MKYLIFLALFCFSISAFSQKRSIQIDVDNCRIYNLKEKSFFTISDYMILDCDRGTATFEKGIIVSFDEVTPQLTKNDFCLLLRDIDCGAGGGGGGNVMDMSTRVLLEACDNNGGVETRFWYSHLYDGAGAFQGVITVDENGAAYIPTGVIGDCDGDCVSDNEPYIQTFTNTLFTFTANNYHSVVIEYESGTTNVSTAANPAVPRTAANVPAGWQARECEYLDFQITIDNTGGGVATVYFIQ